MTALKRKRFQQGRTTSVRLETELGVERLLASGVSQVEYTVDGGPIRE